MPTPECRTGRDDGLHQVTRLFCGGFSGWSHASRFLSGLEFSIFTGLALDVDHERVLAFHMTFGGTLMAPDPYRTKKIRQRRSRVKTVEKRWTHDRQCVPSLTCGLTQHVSLPVVVLAACFACVILTWPWDQWKFPKFEVAWLVVDLLCLLRVFCRVLALAVCQPLAVMLDLIRVVVSWFTLSFHSRTALLTPRTPLTGKGRWCCDFARAGFRQNWGKLPRMRDGHWSLIARDLHAHYKHCHYGMDGHTVYTTCWP